jgi:hypothetical protein
MRVQVSVAGAIVTKLAAEPTGCDGSKLRAPRILNR